MNANNRILEVANKVYVDAFKANYYYLEYNKLRKFVKDNYNIAEISPAFINIVMSSLLESQYLAISRVYDTSNDVGQMMILIKECKDNINIFTDTETFEAEVDEKIIKQTCIPRYQLNKYEIEYRPDVKESNDKIYQLIGADASVLGYSVQMTHAEVFELYDTMLNDLVDNVNDNKSISKDKILQRLKTLRNKRIVHSTITSKDLDEALDNYYLDVSELEKIITLALKLQIYVIVQLTGVAKPRTYSNIDDFSYFERLLKLGFEQNEKERKKIDEKIEQLGIKEIKPSNNQRSS